MLPRKTVPNQDLILCASLNRTMMTTNVHPLYLPPVVCWLNRACVQGKHLKSVIFLVTAVISSILVSVTLFMHMVRLWNLFAWGLLGALWSLTVCFSLIGGCLLITQSLERQRSCSSASRLSTSPVSTIPVPKKLITGGLFLVAHVLTWLYYYICSDDVIAASRIQCADRRGPSLFPILKWTTFVFFWINTIGFLRSVRSD